MLKETPGVQVGIGRVMAKLLELVATPGHPCEEAPVTLTLPSSPPAERVCLVRKRDLPGDKSPTEIGALMTAMYT